MDNFRCFLTLDPRYEICMIIFFNAFLFEYFRLWMLVILWTISLTILCVFIPKSCLALERIRVCLLFRFGLLRHWVWQRLLSLKLYLSVLYLCICLSVYFVFVFIYLACYSGLGEWWDIGRVARRLPLHCTLHCPSTVGVFSALGAGTGSFTLLNNRVRKKSIPFSPFQFYIPKSPETTFMYLSFEPWHKEGLPNAGGAKELYGQ